LRADVLKFEIVPEPRRFWQAGSRPCLNPAPDLSLRAIEARLGVRSA
jgi:hypothetical protein